MGEERGASGNCPTLDTVTRTPARADSRARAWLLLLAAGLMAAGCTTSAASPGTGARQGTATATATAPARAAGGTAASWHGPGLRPPAPLAPFAARAAGEGTWHPAGRPVDGVPAVYEARLVPPGGSQPAGLAWMDSRLLAARLYSGSESPGGLAWRYTAPVRPAQAATLVAAFNGGFKMNDAHGGYYSEGHMAAPLVRGAASLVIYASGGVSLGAWGTDVGWAPGIAAVRQNLVLLVDGGRPTPAAAGNWHAWGNTCGATSCAASAASIERQWRSGVGITADGALVYALGPALDPLQLAELLARAGVVRAMELDINPDWPVFTAYAGGRATPSDGSKLLSTVQGPATFFSSAWARDFITMSAR